MPCCWFQSASTSAAPAACAVSGASESAATTYAATRRRCTTQLIGSTAASYDHPPAALSRARQASRRVLTELTRLLALEVFYDGRDSLPYADAHGGEAIAGLAADQLVDQGGDQAGPAGAQRVTQGNGAATRVDERRVEFEVAHARQYLRREGLVQLHTVEIGNPQAGAGEGFPRCGDRAKPHAGRVDARTGRRQDPRQRPGADPLRV